MFDNSIVLHVTISLSSSAAASSIDGKQADNKRSQFMASLALSFRCFLCSNPIIILQLLRPKYRATNETKTNYYPILNYVPDPYGVRQLATMRFTSDYNNFNGYYA